MILEKSFESLDSILLHSFRIPFRSSNGGRENGGDLVRQPIDALVGLFERDVELRFEFTPRAPRARRAVIRANGICRLAKLLDCSVLYFLTYFFTVNFELFT